MFSKRVWKWGWRGIFLGILVSLAASPAWAHVRHYVWTTEYQTIPKGEFELENWVTFKVPDTENSRENKIQYQEELEYGITDRWTLAHYQRFQTLNKVGPDDATVYQGFKFETKYRFGEKGKYWLDPLLYLEWATDFRDEDHPNAIEGKIVLSKDLGNFNVTYNQIMESELGEGGRTEQNFSVGASYEVLSDFRLGAEFFGNYWHPSSHRNELSLGPTLSYEHKYFWVTAGFGFGVNHASDDMQARVIVGIPF